MSPILFGIYIDELLSRLHNSGYGCKIGHLYYGALGYADDVSFIAPSLHALKMMRDITVAYAKEFDITFNPIKCQFIYYGKSDNVTFTFDDVVLHASEKGIHTHLGHIIGPNVNNNIMLDASNVVTRQVNFVLHNFSYCSYDVRYELLKSYYISFYGSPLWNMTSKCMFVFYVTWRKAIRKLFDIPNRTHCDLLPIIADCKHIETQLLCRLVKFICCAISSQNLHLNMLIDIAMNGSLSPMADSFNHLLSKSKITRYMAKHCDANVLLNIVSNTINIPT